jgi:hypothetical protein
MTDNSEPFELDDEFEENEFSDEIPEDEIIEIEEDDTLIESVEEIPVVESIETQEEITLELSSDVVLSKHTLNRKHSLNYDSIFKGKKESPLTEDEFDSSSSYNETFEVDKSSIYWYESVDNENYIKEKRIRECVYEVLSKHTDLNFLNNRRKPSKVDFNQFYYILKTHLKDENFTNVEIFNELAVYFSDNLFNMFKLLDNKWRNLIISELQDHIGKQPYSKDVMNRNIHLGTEIEFVVEDPLGNLDRIHITGVVIETDYETSIFTVDSYEKIYEIELSDITKILNNTKFRYNLNKLNNIDFL